MWIWLAVTIIIAALGGFIAMKLKIPAGALIGAILLVAIFNVFTGKAFLPAQVKIATQIIAGTFLGCSIKKSDVLSFRHIIKPAFLTVGFMIISCLLMGFLLHKLARIDLVTILFGTSPGGVMDMTLASMDLGADVTAVSTLQIARFICVISFFPMILTFILKKFPMLKKEKPALKKTPPSNVSSILSASLSSQKQFQRKIASFLGTLCVGILSGLFGYISSIPAGTLILSMLGSAIFNIFTEKAFMPLPIKRGAQILAGALIGVSVTLEGILTLRELILPVIFLLLWYVLSSIILSLFLYYTTELDYITAFFACTPGGASDISLICGDFGANAPNVAIIQIFRVVCILTVYPLIIYFINSLV